MEEAIRQMNERNEKSIVYLDYSNRLRIRLQTKKVQDIPSLACRSRDSFIADSIAKWEAEKGLLYYRVNGPTDNLPAADAMLIVECPFQLRMFEKLQGRIKGDIIVYRPPDWSMHQDTIDFIYPDSSWHQTLHVGIKCLQGLPRTPRQELALKFSGFNPDNTSVFFGYDLAAITGISMQKFKPMMKYRFLNFYRRYSCYIPQIPPDDPFDLEIYRVLEAEPDTGGGLRLLRWGEPHDAVKSMRVPGFTKVIKRLVKSGHVTQYPQIYVVCDEYKKPDWEMLDGIQQVRVRNWLKMRDLVDLAPEYIQSRLP